MESARLATVLQENAVLKSEIEILRLKCKNLLEENRRLRQASVNIVSSVLYTCMDENFAFSPRPTPTLMGKIYPTNFLFCVNDYMYVHRALYCISENLFLQIQR